LETNVFYDDFHNFITQLRSALQENRYWKANFRLSNEKTQHGLCLHLHVSQAAKADRAWSLTTTPSRGDTLATGNMSATNTQIAHGKKKNNMSITHTHIAISTLN
jgi:hypothetical protein